MLGAIIVEQSVPAVDGAWRGNRMRAPSLDCRNALFLKPLCVSRRRCLARTIECNDIIAATFRIEAEAVPSDAGGFRFHDALDRAGGYGCIHGVAAGLEYISRYLRRQGVGCAGHAFSCMNWRSAREFQVSHGGILTDRGKQVAPGGDEGKWTQREGVCASRQKTSLAEAEMLCGSFVFRRG